MSSETSEKGEHPPKTMIWLDAQNRILRVNHDYDRFAEENDGEVIRSDAVLGQPLWQFVTGSTTRMWLESILMLARVREGSLERPYRCDSPHLRRFMRMRVTKEDGELLKIEHETLYTEPREKPVYFQPELVLKPKILRRCSICGRVQVQGVWQEAEQVEGSLTYPEHVKLPVFYTVCQSCALLMPNL